MNWDAVAAVSEILGTIAVIISLVYLAIQMRNQSRETRLSTINNSLAEWNSLLAVVANNPELAGIWNRALKNEELSEGEEVQFRAFASSYFRVVEGLYLQHLEGRLDDRIWKGVGNGATELLVASGLRRFWGHRKNWYCPEFREFVESAFQSSESISDSIYRHNP